MRYSIKPNMIAGQNKKKLVTRQGFKIPKGFTVVELSITLLIIGILTAVFFGIKNRIGGDSDAKKMASDLTSLVSGIKAVYQNDPNGYQDVNATNLINAKVIPGDLKIRGTDSVIDQFGQTMIFTSVNGQGGANGFFSIEYPAVPAEICTKLLGSLGPDSYIRIDVGSSTEFSDGSTDGTAVAYPGTTQIATDCGNGSGNKPMTFFSN